jgi:teichuronic acid biosynthesis glycosyltransferase TuaC
VSRRLVNEAIKLGANSDNILYAPNTVNTNLFRPLNKGICRNKLNLPNDIFIVVFVGHFIERKGPLRVLEAIDSLNIPVKGVFLGQGSQEPIGQNVIFSGSVQNRELPEWLNASDVFVLPTLAEGNCNAINEAMACGLPVISSNILDIKYQVPEDAGILVDPNDPKLIADAIQNLYTNKQILQTFGNNCIRYAKKRNIKSRAKQIIDWVIEKELS